MIFHSIFRNQHSGIIVHVFSTSKGKSIVKEVVMEIFISEKFAAENNKRLPPFGSSLLLFRLLSDNCIFFGSTENCTPVNFNG